MNTPMNRKIRNEVIAYMYHEATIISKYDRDICDELFLKAAKAMDRFDPSRGVQLKTYLSKVMQKGYLDIVRKQVRISQREAYDVDMTLEAAEPRKSPVSYEFETEEMKRLLLVVMTKLDAKEKLIVKALLKTEGCQAKAVRLLASRGVFYSCAHFSRKIVPALKAKIKGIMNYENR